MTNKRKSLPSQQKFGDSDYSPEKRTIDLFAAGNYALVAMTGHPDQWQKYAALGMVGKTQEALEGLQQFDHCEARFYSAVARWIDGDDERAIRVLEDIPTPHAQNLLALIRKPHIQVLAQLPWTRQPPHDLLTAAGLDSKFAVQNISFYPEDLPNEPYADVHTFYDPLRPPDFYVCAMAEWHVLPPNLQELPCPLLGETSDYDLHIQAVFPWLQIFDEVFVPSQTEWEDVRRLVSVPVSTFPKSFGVSDELPPLPSEPRVIDVFLSGTIAHPYNPDKADLLHQVLRIPDVQFRFVNGFLSATAYQMLLSRSKVSFTYGRTPGIMPTRGLEALSMGCGVVVQKGSVLSLYVGEEEGVLTYDPNADDLGPGIQRIIHEWPEFEKRTRRGAEIIRREFALSRVASQYLRLLTFLAAKPHGPRQIRPVDSLDQKRPILSKGWLPGETAVMQKMRQENLNRWKGRLEKEETSRLVIDMTRELVLEYTATAKTNSKAQNKDGLLDDALKLYQAGLARFPHSLPLRFNLIRTAFHFGRPQTVDHAQQLAEKTLLEPPTRWKIDVLEDVFPWDFFSTYFNYRKYFDLVTKHLQEGTPVQEDLTRLILASLHYYLGRLLEDLEHLKQAVSLDPEFPFYLLSYARELIRRKEEQKDEEAVALLTPLVENSIVFAEAFELLEQLQYEKRILHPRFSELSRKVSRAFQQGVWREDWQTEALSMAAHLARSDPEGGEKTVSLGPKEKPASSKKEPRVSVLVFPHPVGRFLRGLLLNLENQTIASGMEIVIAENGLTPEEKVVVNDFRRRYGNILLIPSEEGDSDSSFFNRAVEVSSGKFITATHRGDRFRREALERMAKVLESCPEIVLVYPDVDVVEKEILHDTRQSSITALYRWPEFNRRVLFQKNFVGPQPLWRREIHDRFGYFDPQFQAAWDYEFWLRIARTEKFLHLSKSFGFHLIPKGHTPYSEMALAREESEVARDRHWPAIWGERPSPQDNFLISGILYAPSLEAEVSSLSNWSIIPPLDQAEIRGLLDMVRNAMVRQDWSLAEMGLRTSIERFPFFLGAHRTLAALLKIQGRGKEAGEFLQKAMEIQPYALTVLNDLGVILYENGDMAEAEKTFAQALAEFPKDTNALVSLGRLCYDQQRFREALEYLQKATQVNHKDSEAWVGLALSALQLNDRDTFEIAHKRVQILTPNHPLLASLHQSWNRRKRAPSSGMEERKPFPERLDWVEKQPENSGRLQLPSMDRVPRGDSSDGGLPASPCSSGTPLVSAIVSTYNAERFMHGLLEDLESQTIADRLEIVVVDSNSPQNEKAMVREFQKTFGNIVYLRTEERENSHVSFNRCIQMARGKYVTLANTDDRHRTDALEKMVKALEANPDAALAYADVAITDRENEIFETAHFRGYFNWPDFDPRLLFQICYIGPQPVWRRELHDKYGYFDPEFWSAGDYEFWLRLARTEKFIHIPEVLGLYFLSANSNEHKDMSLNFQETEKARERYWPRDWGKRPLPFFNKNPFAVSVGSTPMGRGSKEQILLLKQQGVHFFGQGDRIGAENAFRLALAVDPHDSDVLISLGKICFDSQRPKEALDYLQKAVEENPDDQSALLGLQMVTKQLNNPSIHREVIQKAPPDPQNPVIQSIGRLVSQENNPRAENRNAVISQTIPDPEKINELGEALFNRGKIEEAKEQFQKTLEIDKNFLAAINNLGVVFFHQGEMDQAMDYFKRALSIDPNFSEAAENLKQCFQVLHTTGDREYRASTDRRIGMPVSLPSKAVQQRIGEFSATNSDIARDQGAFDAACNQVRALDPEHPQLASLPEAVREHRFHLKPEEKNSSLEIRVNRAGLRVLLIQLEIPCWERARSWSYAGQLAIEEGFLANRVEFMTIPAFTDIPSTDPGSWLPHARKLCSGKRFDQVWVEVVHSDLDEGFLEWLATLAPVRIGYVAESLHYHPGECAAYPPFKDRWSQVERRLRYFTHALVMDEKDAEDLNAQGWIRALWFPAAMPERYLCESIPAPEKPYALFCGALYGDRLAWLERPELKEWLLLAPPPEQGTAYPGLFDRLIQLGCSLVRDEKSVNDNALETYLNGLRGIRRQVFALWLKGLQQGSAVVNLPHFAKSYSGRVVEGMAAGRPVISWEIPDRPLNKALFEDGKEILLFPKQDPSLLAAHIQQILTEPTFGQGIAESALRKIREFHTIEKRIAQALRWMETGEQPAFVSTRRPLPFCNKNSFAFSANSGTKGNPSEEQLLRNSSSPLGVAKPKAYQDILENYEDYVHAQKVTYCSHEIEVPKWERGQQRYIIDTFGHLDRDLKILDIACGDGVGLRQFRKLGFKNIVAVEFNEAKIAKAEESGYPVFRLDMHDLSRFAENEFDVIYCSHTLEHAYRPDPVVSEFHRILKPKGNLFLVLPYPDLSSDNDEAHGAKYELGANILDDGKNIVRYFSDRGFNLVSKKFDDFREPEIWLAFRKA